MARLSLAFIGMLMLTVVGTASIASAHHHHPVYVSDGTLLVDERDADDVDEDSSDVVSVAEPVYYAPVSQTYVRTYETSYVPVSDTVVTPYGYQPVYNNGYYQGYNYNPQYAYNPYYAGAVYGGPDPLATTVVGTVLQAAVNHQRVSGSELVNALVSGLVAQQTQQAYQNQYQQYGYAQPVYVQPVYTPVNPVQQVIQQVVQPQQVYVQRRYVAPYYVQRGDNGEHRGWYHREGGDGEHGDHGD